MPSSLQIQNQAEESSAEDYEYKHRKLLERPRSCGFYDFRADEEL